MLTLLFIGKRHKPKKRLKSCKPEGKIPVLINAKTVIYARDEDHLERIKIKYNLV